MSASGDQSLSPVERSKAEVDLTDRVRSRMAADRERTENAASAEMRQLTADLAKTHDALVRAYSERVTGDVTRTHAAIRQQLDRVALTSQSLADAMEQAHIEQSQKEKALFRRTLLALAAGTGLGLVLALAAIAASNLIGA